MIVHKIEYKYQRICSLNGSVLGIELLIDSAKTIVDKDLNVYSEVIDNYRYTLSLLKRIALSLDENTLINTKLKSINVFINLELEHLNFIEVLEAVDELNEKLIKVGSRLIIEVTERIPNLSVRTYTYALNFLRSVGVSFAVDDFDIKFDHRLELVDGGAVDFIKLEWDVTLSDEIGAFINKNISSNIILERVEDVSEVKSSLKEFNALWGLQGFYYCEGVPICI